MFCARLRPARQALVLVMVLAMVLPLVGLAQSADAQSLSEIRESLARTQEQQEAIGERLQANQQALEELLADIAALEQEREELTRQIARAEDELSELDAVMTYRVRETFKHGSSLDPLSVLLAGEDAAGALAMATTVQRLVGGDRVKSEDIAAARTRARAAADRLVEATQELREAEEEFERVAEQLSADLEELQELEASLTQAERDELARLERIRLEQERRERERREAEAARRAAAQAAASRTTSSTSTTSTSSSSSGSSGSNSSGGGGGGGGGGGMACPLDQPRNFIDSWGFARSGGRAHRGTDIMGPHGIPVRAITSGTWVHQRVGASAGVWGILRGDNGDHYWYMHLTTHTVSSGSRVSAGQQIGTNGSTGNAHPSAPHVHFELHPGGGSAVNPYSLLRRVCG